jgi:hypothetical protein
VRLDCASRAAISSILIAVVAGLVSVDLAVAADALARRGLTTTAEAALDLAAGATAIVVVVIVVVAVLVIVDDAITTLARGTAAACAANGTTGTAASRAGCRSTRPAAASAS